MMEQRRRELALRQHLLTQAIQEAVHRNQARVKAEIKEGSRRARV
jgi:hypothetical protein